MPTPHQHILLDALDRPVKLLFWTLPQWGVIFSPILCGLITGYVLIGTWVMILNLCCLNRIPYLDKPRLFMAFHYRFWPAYSTLRVLPPAEREEYPK